ncbi:hypothetical protein M0805_000598 [Coniferiporia weirii]|nr:hypothetical protein M0805_000598 [Coniferiporia weirii]
MFKFDFSAADLDSESDLDEVPVYQPVSGPGESPVALGESGSRHVKLETKSAPARKLSLQELTHALPHVLSYSPLIVPLTEDRNNVTLLRRDLFDARYQLISQDELGSGPSQDASSADPNTPSSSDGDCEKTASPEGALSFIDNPSDLVPGVYEGGLKTWECSLDLVDCLASVGRDGDKSGIGRADWVRGKRVLEIGCGTAVPSLYLLHTLFSQTPSADSLSNVPNTEIVLQDYNDLVLQLVTFPNVLLVWYASPLADAYRSQKASTEEDSEEESFDLSQPGDMQITEALLTSFQLSLEEQHITIHFVAGSWQALMEGTTTLFTRPFDVTLTSETIYQVSNLPSLIDLLKQTTRSSKDEDLHLLAENLAITERSPMCLVAAKVLYFGVGGGILDFEHAVIRRGGRINPILQRKAGVGRKVLRVEWT